MSRSLKRTLFKRAEYQIVISEEDEPFTIYVEIRAKDGSTCTVPAILDTGCPVDLVSLSFAREHLRGKDEGKGHKGKGVESERDEDKKRLEIHGVRAPGAKLTIFGEWLVPITATCSQGKTITFTIFCAGIERDSRMPPFVLGMATLEAHNFYIAPRLQSWWQLGRPLISIGERTDAVSSYNFEPENAFFDGRKQMPLRVILDTGTVMDGVSLNFARRHLEQVKSGPQWTWIDVEGKEHPCDGLWELPLCLKSKDHKKRSFTVLCWGMDLGEPSSEGHHSVRLSKATLVEQDILLDCGILSFVFEDRITKTVKTPKNWSQRLIDKAKFLNEKLREPKIDEE
ncbi:unnamed protein product [Clonostachys chloroleuca]|uniref:Uncharacterized protein n=1 Tax=Clonostachys chloroleuca TaxID=1926264 RepID=A0AA35QB95_9HYPO|nr:unnamed protein product [Clonostachys chloroleuca]